TRTTLMSRCQDIATRPSLLRTRCDEELRQVLCGEHGVDASSTQQSLVYTPVGYMRALYRLVGGQHPIAVATDRVSLRALASAPRPACCRAVTLSLSHPLFDR